MKQLLVCFVAMLSLSGNAANQQEQVTLPEQLTNNVKEDTEVQPYVAYLVAYMTGKDEKHLYYAVAEKDFVFEPVNEGRPVLSASFDDKLIRDPHVLRCPDGKFRMVATVSWKNRPFTLWESDDLVNWKNERLVDVAPEGASKTWAPELAYDENKKRYVVYWTAEVNNDWKTAAIYYATTKDFKKWSKPAVLYASSDDGILDANLIKVGDTWHLLYRYAKGIWEVTSKLILGPYSNPHRVGNENVEGPFAFPLNDESGYGLVWDYYYGSCGFGLITTPDFQSWTHQTNTHQPYYNDKVRFPDGIRHGSILGLTAEELKRIKVNYSSAH